MVATPAKITTVFAVSFLYLASAFPVRAEFLLNFEPQDSIPVGFLALTGSCNMAGFIHNTTGCATGGGAEEVDPDLTPYFMEQVTVDNITYWHQIIGDPDEGFAMEVYTQVATHGFASHSGGRNSNLPFNMYRQDLDVQSGNGWDPLELDPATNFDISGNGSGDPARVVMRQILGGTWNSTTRTLNCSTTEFCMDFTKATLDGKPRIAQTVNDASEEFSAFFDLDMSSISYADDTTAGTLINTVTLPNPLPVVATVPMTTGSGNTSNFDNGGSLDMATGQQNSTVSGGRYTYTPGAGWVDFGDGSGYETWDYQEGTYNYVSGGLDHLNQNWAAYFDPAQNPFPGPGNEGKCDSGAVTSTCP